MFSLSRDYQKAFELIKSGDRLVCLLDYDGCKDVAIARTNEAYGDLIIGARGISYLHLLPFQASLEPFLVHCDRLNIEFFLPISEEMIVVSTKDFKEIVALTIIKSLAPVDKMIKAIEGAVECNKTDSLNAQLLTNKLVQEIAL